MGLEDIRLYTVQETAELLGVTTRTILTYLKEGKLTGRKIGGKWKMTEEELRRFMSPAQGEGDKTNVHH